MVSVPCYRCNRYHRIVSLDNMLSHHKGIVLESSRPSLLIKRAALGNLKASFHCTHWHRFFPLKKAFSKTYPSFLTLKEGSTSHLGLLPSGKKRETALRCSEPLRSKVGGPSKVSPYFAGWDRLGKGGGCLGNFL